MTDRLTENLIGALKGGSDVAFLSIRCNLETVFPGMSILETEDGTFNPFYFSKCGKCTHRATEDPVQEWTTIWNERRQACQDSTYHNWIEFEWEGSTFTVLFTGVHGAHCRENRIYIVGESDKTVRAFFTAVCEFCSEVRDEILVFDDGGWSKDDDLFKAIKISTLDSLVLEGTLKDDIVGDIERFLSSKALFDQYKIAWKRGILLLGPPGNGKTHMIKALANRQEIPCLYVRSIVSEYSTEQHNINAVFERARAAAPCLLVFEDLDTLINKGNRSYFMNEMDGFYENRGLFVIATTNHPEKLDPAIVDRPSRFDRKYHFELPDAELRTQYLAMWNAQINVELQISDEELQQVVASTEGFSFAYLKELGLSSLMTWIGSDRTKPMIQCILEQSEWLRGQMTTLVEEPIDHRSRSSDRAKATRYAMMRKMRKSRGLEES